MAIVLCCLFWVVYPLCLIVEAENFNTQKLDSSMLKDDSESNTSSKHNCANTWFVWNPQKINVNVDTVLMELFPVMSSLKKSKYLIATV